MTMTEKDRLKRLKARIDETRKALMDAGKRLEPLDEQMGHNQPYQILWIRLQLETLCTQLREMAWKVEMEIQDIDVEDRLAQRVQERSRV